MIPVLFAHGLEGSPGGRKPAALRAAGLAPHVPDCRGLPLARRVQIYEAALLEYPEVVLVGSSYGGLAALWLVQHHAERVRALVLCAPALHHAEPPVTRPGALCVPAGVPAVTIHGLRDEVVPIAVSRALTARSPHVRLVEVDDDHRLAGSLEIIVGEVRTASRRSY